MGVGTRYQLVWTKLLFLFLFLRIHCFICFHFSSTKRIRSFYVDVFEFNTIYVYVFMCTYTYTWGCFDVSGIKVNVQHCARARANFLEIVPLLGTLDSIGFVAFRCVRCVVFIFLDPRSFDCFDRGDAKAYEASVSRPIVSATVYSAGVPLAGPRFDLSAIFGSSPFLTIARLFEELARVDYVRYWKSRSHFAATRSTTQMRDSSIE